MTGERGGQLLQPEGGVVHDRAFDTLTTNPARALLYLVASYAGEPQAESSLIYQLNKLQGPEPRWRLSINTFNMPRQYAATLVPAELLERTTVTGRDDKQVGALQPGRLDNTRSRVMAFTALDWELQFPEYRLLDLFGQTRLTDELSMPATSLRLYNSLLELGAASTTQMCEFTGLPFKKVERTLRGMQAGGGIEKESTFNFNDRVLKILPTPENYRKGRLGNVPTARLAIFEIAEALFRIRKGETTILADTFVSMVLAACPETDEATVREHIIKKPPVNIDVAGREKYDNKRTLYTIRQDILPAIADFCVRIALIESNHNFVDDAAFRGPSLLEKHRRSDVAFLMAKSKPLPPGESWDGSTRAKDRTAMERVGRESLTITRLPIASDWWNHRACSDADPELFFPANDAQPLPHQAEQAKAICKGCNVRSSCLQWTVDKDQGFGIAGGMTGLERQTWAAARRAVEKSLHLQNVNSPGGHQNNN